MPKALGNDLPAARRTPPRLGEAPTAGAGPADAAPRRLPDALREALSGFDVAAEPPCVQAFAREGAIPEQDGERCMVASWCLERSLVEPLRHLQAPMLEVAVQRGHSLATAAAHLHELPSVQVLGVTGLTRIEGDKARDFAALMARTATHPGVEALHFRGIDLSNPAVAAPVGTLLRHDTTLVVLDFDRALLDGHGLEQLCAGLQRHPKLRALALRLGLAYVPDLAPLCNALATHPTLRSLTLCCSPRLARSVVDALRAERCPLSDLGLKELVGGSTEFWSSVADMVASNRLLHRLRIERCTVPEGFLGQLACALDRNATLLHLTLNECRFGPHAMAAFVQSLARNLSLESVDLGRLPAPLQEDVRNVVVRNRLGHFAHSRAFRHAAAHHFMEAAIEANTGLRVALPQEVADRIAAYTEHATDPDQIRQAGSPTAFAQVNKATHDAAAAARSGALTDEVLLPLARAGRYRSLAGTMQAARQRVGVAILPRDVDLLARAAADRGELHRFLSALSEFGIPGPSPEGLHAVPSREAAAHGRPPGRETHEDR